MTDVSEITMEEQQSTAPLMATNGNTKSTLKGSRLCAASGMYPESESTVTLQRSASPGGSPQVRFQVTPTLSSRGSREAARRRTASSSSHFSDSSSPDDDSVTLERHAPDGGWGWVVVAASFIVNMIADGVGFSFGVFFVEFLRYFRASKSEYMFFVEFLRYFRASKSTTAWLGSIFLALPLLLGPVASSLVDRFGCRKSTIAGSLLAATGFLLSYFANSMEILFLTFSIMPGIGLSVCYVSAVVIVAYYFERRRSLATGISVCGTGVGTFLFPPMVELLLQEYGWRGSLLILSGVFLNMAVCGMLMKDLDWTKHKNRERSSQITLSGVGDSDSIPGDADSLPDIEQLRNALNSGDVVALLGRSVSQEQLERLHSSALQLPTWLADQDVSPEVLKTIDSNHKIHDLVYRLYPHLLANGPTDEAAATVTGAEAVGAAEEGRAGPDPAAAPSAGFTIGYGDWKETSEGATATKSETTTQKEAETATGNGKPADASDIYTGSPADASAPGGWEQFRSDNVLSTVDHTNMPVPEARVSRSVPHQRHQREQQMHQQRHRYQTPRTSARTSNLLPLFSCDSAPSAAYLRNMRLRRQSMTYRGAMLHIQRYRLRASSCPDIYRNSMITITSREEDETCCGCLSDIARVMRKMIDPSYFRLPGFMLFALSNFVLYMFYDVPYVYLADDAIQRGTSDEDASMLISVIGVSNVIGVLSIGYLGDRPWVSSTVLYVTCMLSCGASILLVPSCHSYSALVAVSTVFGFCISANYTLAPTILVSLISIDNFTSAYGLLLLAQGLANLVGPPLCGMLHDLTSTYELTFRTSGTAVVISGLLLCLARLVKAARASKRALKRVTSTDTSGAMSATGSTDMI